MSLRTAPTPQSRPASGPPRSAWAGGKKAALSVPSTAAAATAELKQKGEALERSLRSEELARNAAQLERVRRGCRCRGLCHVLRTAPATSCLHRFRLISERPWIQSSTIYRASTTLPLPQNKIQAFWDITRRQLGDARAELLVKDRELEEEEVKPGGHPLALMLPPSAVRCATAAQRGSDIGLHPWQPLEWAGIHIMRNPEAQPTSLSFSPLQDRHGLELKVYKQRVRHLLYEHAAHVARLKADAEAALKAQVGPCRSRCLPASCAVLGRAREAIKAASVELETWVYQLGQRLRSWAWRHALWQRTHPASLCCRRRRRGRYGRRRRRSWATTSGGCGSTCGSRSCLGRSC